jgi:hypothetical protein
LIIYYILSKSILIQTDNEINNIDALPLQDGNSGKFLSTSGSVASWESVDALPTQSGNNNYNNLEDVKQKISKTIEFIDKMQI